MSFMYALRSGFGLCLIGVGLMSCSTVEEGPPTRPAAEQTCAPGAHEALLGASVAAAADIADPKRIVRPGSALTMDYRPDRTNIEADESGRITRIWCG
ncbi:I78 family peptidase inhibitor [Primorskyibacter sp. S187A]|uniref:I78 family peptidase inhibitor n=1 Tax=Primorskyibacter sp. S187A TaxID=3415130 RepID=UPI003C79C2A6